MRYLLIITGLTLWACHIRQNQGIERSVLVDKTDTQAALPSPRDLLSSLSPDEHKWEELSVRLQVISNIDYNPVFLARLKGRDALLSNPYDRDKERQLFEQKVIQAIDSINKMADGLPRSSIYSPLIREANRLAASPASVRELFIYSNLGQNTTQFSVYNATHRRLLKEKPDTIEKRLLKMAQPENLTGMTIYFMHTPSSEADSEVYTLMAGLFKRILERAGARVYIGANEAGTVN